MHGRVEHKMFWYEDLKENANMKTLAETGKTLKHMTKKQNRMVYTEFT
jgi:hypothetical protein